MTDIDFVVHKLGKLYVLFVKVTTIRDMEIQASVSLPKQDIINCDVSHPIAPLSEQLSNSTTSNILLVHAEGKKTRVEKPKINIVRPRPARLYYRVSIVLQSKYYLGIKRFLSKYVTYEEYVYYLGKPDNYRHGDTGFSGFPQSRHLLTVVNLVPLCFYLDSLQTRSYRIFY